MEYEIEGTLKLPTLYFDDEKLVVEDKGQTKIYLYRSITDIHIAYKQRFADFGVLELISDGKQIIVPYNKRCEKELEKAVKKVNDHKTGTPLSEDPFELMKKYKEMLDLGILSQEEFEAKKKELLRI